MPHTILVLGAGVVGLTTALHLSTTFPEASITVLATHLPGDRSIAYTSPWAGANWSTVAKRDDARLKAYDRIALLRLREIARTRPEAGVVEMPQRLILDAGGGVAEGNPEPAVREKRRRVKEWYEELVGGVRDVPPEALPEGAVEGVEYDTVIINTAVYLSWLQTELAKRGVQFRRIVVTHIKELVELYPDATAIFNCTGLGARTLGGVEDKNVYATKGETLLIADPDPRHPLTRMYVRQTPSLGGGEFTHVFPRPLGGGIIIGGVRKDNDWSPEPDPALGERIKARACALCPELGRPEDLKVVAHNVGLRPSRKGNTRVEAEEIAGKLVVHNYGASGAGYQSSWGSAYHAVDLLQERLGGPRQFKL